LSSFSTWDLSKGRDVDHILAALSSVFVYGNTPANLSSLIANFQNDIADDGRLTDPAVQAILASSARAVNPGAVADNLSRRYVSTGAQFNPSDISEWLDQDGDGLIAKFKFNVADATSSSSFTLPSSAMAAVTGLPITVNAGRLSINGTPATTPTQVSSSDVVTIAPAPGSFPQGTLTVYVLTGTTKVARVTFVRGLASIIVAPDTPSLPIGSNASFTATGIFTDGSTADLTSTAHWSSTAPLIAQVNPATGVTSAIAVGAAEITATSGSISGSATVNVVPAELTSIEVTPASVSVGVGVARQLQAIGMYSDGTEADLTGTATWTASQPSIANVAGGLVVGSLVGSTEVMATVGAISGQVTLTVSANAWSTTASLPSRRSGHTATLLPSGKLLVLGGQGETSLTLTRADLYDPLTDRWSVAPDIPTAHRDHTATLLPNGKVLVAGGMVGLTSWSSSVELYDPATNTWSVGPDMPNGGDHQTATLLPNGKLLIVGGSFAGPLSDASIYDPGTNSWSTVAHMAHARTLHTSTLLANGTVLVAGGVSNGTVTASAELYDPASNAWTPAANMSAPRSSHTSIALMNGDVLVLGGSNTATLASAETYNVATNTWTAVSNMTIARDSPGAVFLPNHKILVVAGDTNSQTSTEIYDPTMDLWTPGPSLSRARFQQTTTRLSNGTVMVVGGNTGTCEIYW